MDLLWNERFWFPEGVTWEDLRNVDPNVYIPQIEDIGLLSIFIGFVLLIIRFLSERLFVIPLAKCLGIKVRKNLPLSRIPELEHLYRSKKTGSRDIKVYMQQIYTVQIRSLAYVDVLLNPENENTAMMNSHTVGKSVGVDMQQIYTVQIRSLAYVDVLLNPEYGNTTMMNSHTVGVHAADIYCPNKIDVLLNPKNENTAMMNSQTVVKSVGETNFTVQHGGSRAVYCSYLVIWRETGYLERDWLSGERSRVFFYMSRT
uniref:Uncharacterized protein LOC111114900 isoform X2 n=1 Tax=Crassostrea virginica TaxID=6565 RepID=A0A8B8C221_CRAVI|nr:uncharacterized protein LOC111114900 isoform X2 [Crassostrea virginica]